MIINNRYEIRNFIGKGGMSEIYKGYDLVLKSDVALKFIDIWNETYRKNIYRYFDIVKELEHPNIVKHYKLIETVHKEKRCAVIVMEFVNFNTLSEYIYSDETRKNSDYIDILIGILKGIEFYHKFGVIHNDLKPQNILLQKNNETGKITPKIADFYFCYYHPPFSELPINFDMSATYMIGTPNYMSPERLSNRFGGMDGNHSDIWSFGIIVYEMLKRELPYKIDNNNYVETAFAAILNDLNLQGLNFPFNSIIELCLQKEIQNRVNDASILINLLNNSKQQQDEFINYEIVNNNLLKELQVLKNQSIIFENEMLKKVNELNAELEKQKTKPPKTIYSKQLQKVELLNLIANDNINLCFNELYKLELLPEHEKAIILLQSQWNNNQKKSMLGLMTHDDEILVNNKIKNALIELIYDMKDNPFNI